LWYNGGMTTKSCGTCRWFDADPLRLGFVEEDDLGSCEWPASNLPYSLRWANRERVSVARTDGVDCSCWELKK
jgi:hypothetical protein